ncbi:MAG: OadG family protein [Clostridiales bacterium]|nr:OadG family protein [Clostridiales bacterium]
MQLSVILKEGLNILILGMGITFIALILLILIVNAIRWITNIGKKQNDSGKTNIGSEEANIQAVVVDSDTQADNGELIAVISASIAMMLTGSNQRFKVTRIRQIPSNTPKWNRVGRTEQILNKR